MAEFAPQRERGLVGFERFFFLAEVGAGSAEVIEGLRFAAHLADGAPQRESLVQIVERLLAAAHVGIAAAEIVEGAGFSATIVDFGATWAAPD